jgi:molybdopterin-guanine dinucleotide biosynthesis protein A
LRPLVDEVVVVAKPQTALPSELDAAVWHDDEQDFHPRHGLVTALRRAAPVLVLAVDLPAAAPALQVLAKTGPTSVARADGRLQPLCAFYDAGALGVLEAAPPDEPLTTTVEQLHPVVVDIPAAWLRNVNRPEDL